MRPLTFIFSLSVLFFGSALRARAEPEMVVAIRYLQSQGTSHSHLYLYEEGGKLIRQLTNDNAGQDLDPVFAPDGGTIVFTREKPDDSHEFWSIEPRGKGLQKLKAAPDWYSATKSSPYFTNRDEEEPTPPPSSIPAPSPQEATSPTEPAKKGDAPRYQAPDGSVELVLQTRDEDEDDSYDGPGHGKHFLLRDLKSGGDTELGKVPGFFGLYELLHGSDSKDRQFLFEGSLRLAFFGLHLNSTDGDTDFALDLNGPRLVRLSPNWAAPIPLPGEAAFLSLTENRYVPIPGSSKTANCSYMEHWDASLNKIRYAKPGSAAICYGASLYRSGRTPPVIVMRKNAD